MLNLARVLYINGKYCKRLIMEPVLTRSIGIVGVFKPGTVTNGMDVDMVKVTC